MKESSVDMFFFSLLFSKVLSFSLALYRAKLLDGCSSLELILNWPLPLISDLQVGELAGVVIWAIMHVSLMLLQITWWWREIYEGL